jgi:hypothetical protein
MEERGMKKADDMAGLIAIVGVIMFLGGLVSLKPLWVIASVLVCIWVELYEIGKAIKIAGPTKPH